VNEHFAFPWKEDVITPVSKLFGAKELQDDTDEVLVGHINEFVYFAVGEVEIWLREIAGTFPKMGGLLNPADNFVYLNVDPTDAAFVLDRIGKMPGSKDHESPIWISLADTIQVRAHDHPHQSCTALELSRSSCTEKDVKMSCNRLFLKNALQFGCLRIGMAPNETAAVICFGTDRTFVFMPLDSKGEPEIETDRMSFISSESQSAVTTATKATAVKASTESAPKRPVDTPASAPVKRRRKVAAVKRATATTQCENTVLLESAEQVRQTLRKSMLQVRDSLTQVNDLIRTAKAHRRQERLLQNTMDSLRKLNIV
jgi:hypothetical protein